MNGPRTALRSSLSDRERRKAATDAEHPQSVRNDLSRFSGRVEDGPGGVGSTSQGLTHPDRLHRSEGCREGYPPRPNPNYWFQPVSGKNPARRPCPAARRRAVLEYQGYVCVYCAIPFGSVIVKNGRLRVSSCHLDHFVPLAYLNCNPAMNWVAACDFCNIVKANMMFSCLADARSFILDIRDRRGDYVDWYATVSCEEYPERWAVKFATFLAGRHLEDEDPT